MTLNLQKEFRTLAFPAGVILAAVLVGVWADSDASGNYGYRAWVAHGGLTAFILGIPLLAALPFGSEFQQKTMVLLLSAPVSRTTIWRDKWLAMSAVVAGLSATVFTIGFMRNAEWPFVPAAGFILLVICSAPLWTLVTRSTMGGLVFAPSSIGMLELAIHYVRYHFTGTHREELFGTSPMLDILRVMYAAGMLYGGWLVFTRFQVAATGIGARPAGQTDTAWAPLRARRTGTIANLVRKELMLQRPAFLVAALFAMGWSLSVALTAAGITSPQFANVLPAMLFAGHIPLVVVLAGTVPVGEDTSLGLRDWHLTLPVSAFVQWAIKLLVAVGVVVLLALAVPGLFSYAAGRLTDGQIHGVEVFRSPSFLLIVIGATLLAFWSSTMFGDTLRAAIATGAAALSVGVCAALGSRIADWIPLRQAWWSSLTIRCQLPPFYLETGWMFGFLIGLVFAAVVAVGLPQSYAAFRRVRVSRGAAFRNGAVLFLVALAAFTFIANLAVSMSSSRFRPAGEVRGAVMKLAVPPQEKVGDPPRVVTVEELDRVGHLSPDTHRWLANATIELERMKAPYRNAQWYMVTVRFPNGLSDRFLSPITP